MSNLNLKDYSPIISDKKKGEIIYNDILALNPQNDTVEIDMGDIVSMTTYCAKLIFGRLYVDLGADVFYNNILLKNLSDDVAIIIKMGIKSAVEES